MVDKLYQANKINDEIKELDRFLYVTKKVWSGKIGLKKLFSTPYGFYDKEELELNTEIKNRILVVLEDYMKEKEKELKEVLSRQ